MPGAKHAAPLTIDPATLWQRCFVAAPLVVVGTREPDGRVDLAPKHMVTPLSWEDHIGFVCTPAHATYRNIVREGCFTMSFPRPEQVVLASLAAAPRCEDQKASVDAIPTIPARKIDGVLLVDAYLQLECELERIVDGFGSNSLIAGKIVYARAAADAIRGPDVDDQDLLSSSPVLVYLNPGRYAAVGTSYAFPFHEGTSR